MSAPDDDIDVFISYAAKDAEHDVLHPHELANWLESEGYKVWWDLHMGVGDAQKQLGDKVARARYVIALWSPRTDESRNVFYECQPAANADKLLPILIEGTVDLLPEEWRHLHRLVLTDFEAQKSEILRKLLPRPRFTTSSSPAVSSPKHFRIFLSTPKDVGEERRLASELFRRLPTRPFVRDRFTFDCLSWDDANARIPFEAHVPPQATIDRRLARPSECDIFVLILWGRMGTPLSSEYKKQDGSGYVSGTEWEYEDALQAARISGRPHILVYSRQQEPLISLRLSDEQIDEQRHQYRLVQSFLSRFSNSDGSLSGGVNPYYMPQDFVENLEQHVLWLLDRQ